MVLQVSRARRSGNFHMRPGQPVTLESIRARLVQEASHHEDVIVKGRDIEIRKDGLIQLRGGDGRLFSWNDHAFGQFCAKIGVPADFVRRSPEDGPASKSSIINHWKEQVDGRAFTLRLRNLNEPDSRTGAHGFVRAFMTDRFSKFDNLEMLDVMEPFIRANDLELQLGAHTDQSFHLRLLSPDFIEMGTEAKSDPHKVGIHVLNSEIGKHIFHGDFLVYRQVCTNGLVSLFDKKHLFHHKHVGVELHEIRTSISAGLEKMQDYTEITVERLKSLKASPVTDPLRELHRSLKAGRATDEFVSLAMQSYEEEPIPTRFGVIQAITRAAQKLPTFDARVQMEELAGRLLAA